MKKLLSFLLALALVVVPFGSFSYAEAVSYADVTLTSTDGWNTHVDNENGNWVLYLNTSGYTSNDWGYKYEGFTYEIGGVEKTTSQVSSATNNKLYCTIPLSDIPADNGTVFTIKAGNYDAESGTSEGLHITEDLQIVTVDSRLVHTKVIEPATVEPFNHSANSFYFSTKDARGNAITTGYESWTNFLSPAWCDGTRVDSGDWTNVYSGVLIDGAPMNYWDAHFKNNDAGIFYIDGLNAVNGTTITVKGLFASSTQADWSLVGNFFLPEMRFTYDGSVWTYTDPNAETIVEENRSLSLLYANDDNKYGTSGGIFLTGDDTIEGDTSWGTFIPFDEGENNGVFLNGTKTNVQMKKISEHDWYVCLSDASVTAQEGDVVTVKGAITYKNKTAVFNAVSFVFDGTTWAAYTASENCTFEQFYINDTDQFGTQNGIYLTGTDSLEHDETWGTFLSFDEGEENGVFLNGTKTSVPMKKFTATNWYVCLSDASIAAQAGDEVTVKGAITYKGMTSVFEAITLIFDGTTWNLGEDPSVETGRTLSLDVQVANPEKGIWLVGNDSLPALGWDKNVNAQAGSDNGVFVNGTRTDVFMKKHESNKWYVCLSDLGIIAQANDQVVIKGIFVYENTKISFNEVKFVFDGTTWKEVEDESTISLDFVDLLAISKYNVATNKWEIYLSTTKALPGADEVTTFDVAMNIGGVDTTVTAHKSSQQHAFAFEIDGTVIPQNPEQEVTLTIEAGKYNVVGEDAKIKLTSDTTIYFANGEVSLVSSDIDIKEKDITFTIDRTMQGGGTKNGIYLTATDNVPFDATWGTNTTAYEGKANGVFLNGVKTSVFLKKYESNKYYVCLSDVNVVPQEGDVVVIKGVFKTNDYLSSYKEYALTFKDGSWVDGTEVETKFTTVTITGYDTSISRYNDALNRYELFFTTKEKLPGNVDQIFNSITVDINGKEYIIPCYHSGHKDTFLVIIESDKIKKNETAKITFSGKAKSDDLSIGLDVQKFTLYVNKYGQSLDGYPKAVKVKEKNVKLTLDTATFGWTGGTESGINLLTSDKFPIDNTWATPIRAIAYDENSGVFYNGTKIDAVFKKHADGLIYLDIAMGGVFAKDKDKITIKGTFAVDGYGVSYKEQSFYYNGQNWATTYKKPIPKTTVKLNPVTVTETSGFNAERKAWDVYVQVDDEIPGGHDYEYKTLSYVVNGKTYEANVYRVNDTLVFFVPETVVPKDAKDGTAITLKAGTASDNYNIYDIKLTKDITAYIYRKDITAVKPTENTQYLDITIPGLIRTWKFNEEYREWQLFFIVEEEFDVEDGTKYYDLPVKVNGKSYEEINVFRSGECLYISIPESALPANAKSATLTIGKGSTAVGNAGWNGIRLKNEVNAYMYDGVWNNVEFKKDEVTELRIEHINFTSYNQDAKRWDLYVNVNTEIPGSNWFEYFEGVTVYLNGKEFTTFANKAEYPGDKLLYISLDEATFGVFKEGDKIHIPGDVTYSCGGYKIKNTRDFYLVYENGMWFEYYEGDGKAPKVQDTIWENGRIEGYIPVQEEQGIMFVNVAPTNIIKSVEDMKDVAYTFDVTKMMAYNEELPTNSMVLRGKPLAEGMAVSETALYGYNISFSYIELTEAHVPNNPELWGTHSQEIEVWKNGINYQLLDQYRMFYNWQKTDHPFFEYNEKYTYKVSIHNVTEDVVMISVHCNDKLIMQVVDHGTEDPKDPVYNAGEFQIYASCPQYFYSPEVELEQVMASVTECYIGEQVRVSATYPAILEGSEYTVEGEGATIKDGVFKATQEGTYTVTGKFNGKDKGSVQIKVTKKPVKVPIRGEKETNAFPVIPVVGGGAVVLAGIVLLIILLKKKKTKV